MEQRLGFTTEEAAARQKGTKWFMVGWYTYNGLIWNVNDFLRRWGTMAHDVLLEYGLRPNAVVVAS